VNSERQPAVTVGEFSIVETVRGSVFVAALLITLLGWLAVFLFGHSHMMGFAVFATFGALGLVGVAVALMSPSGSGALDIDPDASLPS
jgi:hypothetical protein